MGLLHYPFAFDAEDLPRAFTVDASNWQKLHRYLARLYARRPAENLVLIELPGIDKTRLRDPMVRIVTAGQQSLSGNLYLCLNFVSKSVRSFVKRLNASSRFDHHPNADWNILFENMGTAACDSDALHEDPYLPALIASFKLRNWVTTE